VDSGDDELMAVKMDRMMIHAEVDEAEADPAAETNKKRSGRRSAASVEGEPVEFHGSGVGNGIIGKDGPFLENDAVVVIDWRRVGDFRMGDEHAEQANHFLHGAVSVIEEGAFLVDGEFVGEGAAGRDGFLADEGDAVLFDRNFEAVPVHGRAFGKTIFEDDADAIALGDLDSRAGTGTVVAPGVDGFEGSDLKFEGLGFEAEDLDAAVELEGEIGEIGSEHGRRGSAGRRTATFGGTLLRIVIDGRGERRAEAEESGAEEHGVLKEISARTAHKASTRARLKMNRSPQPEDSRTATEIRKIAARSDPKWN